LFAGIRLSSSFDPVELLPAAPLPFFSHFHP
jgi:hypothetical protein